MFPRRCRGGDRRAATTGSQTVQAHDRRPEHEPEYAEGADHSERGAFGSLERQALGCEFTQDDVKCGYDDKGDSDCDGVRSNRRERPKETGQIGLDQTR